jgi:hypothetical protein
MEGLRAIVLPCNEAVLAAVTCRKGIDIPPTVAVAAAAAAAAAGAR